MKHVALFSILLCLLAGQGLAQYQLPTPGLASNVSPGTMFDIQAGTADIRITGFDTYFQAGLAEVEIYRVTNGTSFVGNENDANAWTLVATATISSNGGSTPTQLPCALDVDIRAGATQGFYITVSTGLVYLNYRTGTNSGGVLAANTDLTIREGVGKNYPFGTTFGTTTAGGSSRNFCGVVRYDKGFENSYYQIGVTPTVTDAKSSVTLNLRAEARDVVLDRIAVTLAAGTHDLELWVTENYLSSGAVGTNPGDWRKIGSTTGFVASGGRDRLPMDFEVVIPKGTSRGFYLVSSQSAGIPFSNVNLASPSDKLTVLAGKSYAGPGLFTNQVSTAFIQATYYYHIPEQNFGITPGGTGVMTSPATPSFFDVGTFYDVKSNEAIVIESLDHVVLAGTHTIEVWAVTGGGSWASNQSNQAAWTLISTESVTAANSGSVQVAKDLRLFIPAGGVQGLYVTGTSNGTNSILYEQDFSTAGDFATDGTVTLATGGAGDYPFVPQVYSVKPNVSVHYRELGQSLGGFLETFASASGIQPPSGWISSLVTGDRPKLDGWRFDNPGGRPINSPISAPMAICDSDESGSGNPIDAALISPRFDASIGKVTLAFDHHFRQFDTSVGAVEVWNGSSWVLVASFSADTANPAHQSYDITAAAGGYEEAMIRFRYTGDFEWWWMIDNVHLAIGQLGQRPQLGIGEFDINYATDAVHGQPVSSGLPGPYVATADIFSPTVFRWDGEPNQPVQLFVGNLNLANVVLMPQGQLDVGSYDPGTGTFPGILLLADGTAPDLLNAAFRTSSGGRLVMPLYLPPYTVGFTYHFQSVVYSSTQNIALTNVVSMTVE
ncbi:MAG: hypothetical protein H6807_04060 [Planctomycetes bacterium]|nr:hypothetical protein [Planctomycetota bacterium]